MIRWMFASYFEVEGKLSSLVIALIGTDDHLEVQQVVGIGKVCRAGAGEVEFVDVCWMNFAKKYESENCR